jgi:hypothetical protein
MAVRREALRKRVSPNQGNVRMQTHRKLWLGALALAVATLAAPARAAELDKLLPGDAEVVAVVNVRQALDSALVKKYALDQVKALLKGNNEAQQIMKATGLDPLKDIERVIATNTGGLTGKSLVLIKGRFDVDKIHATATEVAKNNPDLKITKEGIFQLYELKGPDKTAYLAFANKETLAGSDDKAYLLDILQGKVKPQKKPLEAVLQKLPGKESVWVAALVTEDLKQAIAGNAQFKDLAPALQAVTGSLDLTDSVNLNLLVHTNDPKAAAKLRMLIQGFVPVVQLLIQGQVPEQVGAVIKELLNNQNFKVGAEGGVASVNLRVTDELIQKAIKAAQQPPDKP